MELGIERIEHRVELVVGSDEASRDEKSSILCHSQSEKRLAARAKSSSRLFSLAFRAEATRVLGPDRA